MKMELMVSTFCPYCVYVKSYLKTRPDLKVEIVNIDKDKNAREKLIEKGGMLQVPCLFLDDKAVYESKDIVAYLKTIG